MIVKGLSFITSICVLFFLGAVGMQKMGEVSEKPHPADKLVAYEYKEEVNSTRIADESREAFHEIKKRAEEMIYGVKKIAAKGLKKIEAFEKEPTNVKRKPVKRYIEEDNFVPKRRQVAKVEKRKVESREIDSYVTENLSETASDQDSLASLHEIDSSLMRIGGMLNDNNY